MAVPQLRRARLLWYGLGALAGVLAMNCCSSSFVPAPGAQRSPALRSEVASAMSAATAAALTVPTEAWAKGGVWGPLEGKASSLVHPFIMFSLFFVTLYTGFLGVQWRQTRLAGVELSDLRKQLPKDDPEAEPSAAVKALKAQISELDAKRKELIKGAFKDKHFATSSILLGGGVFFTAYGVFNTFFRAEKLFPGPHLYAGASIVVLWALAAACVPFMEKGNEAARNVHIALNVLNLALFVWQLPTGLEIAQKVLGLDIPLF
eukprot:TRINITY_DN41820_c0_g1_i1.p1 TRINITY_DN41820_c0_g1~~TRINITY_DN41820_c0_g1_i1.p1  ORF type:complete len:280 (-),score=63.85 TRINITY_DN41820_c0_g1_i1:281-1066(-)